MVPYCSEFECVHKIICKLSMVFIGYTLSLYAYANGVSINEQSSSAAGTAYAGRASSALDASTIYGNPAGLSKLKAPQVSAGLAVIDVKDDISAAQSNASGTNKGNSIPFSSIPFAYLSTPVNDRITFGLGTYVPYGIINDYENGFQGRYHGSYSKVKVVTVQPTLSYRFNDIFSIGIGPTINRIDGRLDNKLDTEALNPGKGDSNLSIKGSDTAIGYNVGVLWDLSSTLSLGLTYHSKVDYRLQGHTKLSNSPDYLGLNGKYETHMDVTLPESLDISTTYRLNQRWTGYLGTTWTRWSRIKEMTAVNKDVPEIGRLFGFDRISDQMNWHDTWAVAAGVSYQVNNRLILRTGFAYDPSPTKNLDRTVRSPVGDRKTISFGFGYSVNESIALDAAYAYVQENTASVHQSNESGLQPAYSAKYDNSACGLTAQLTYRF